MSSPSPSYQVLARKYRPVTFADLKGQDALVRTLSNAIASQRIAHAFLLTGIRGIGKTTTARIIARSLNCIGIDGKGGPTITPCGECIHCVSIREDRHPDILEMDAASRTGVDSMREIIENSRYLPTMARYKIYIIDEVHMLSNNAFNALLKTLEEPPPHVKFILATTETRKIPVTIVSRCQRFDLRRLSSAMLQEHLQNIAARESVAVDADALALIAEASEGSVRDSLSLLDQAIAHNSSEGAASVTASMVRDMLGLADKSALFAILEHIVSGNIPEALQELRGLYHAGADSILILEDLLELTHFITTLHMTPSLAQSLTIPEMERERGQKLADQLQIPHLTRMWQMLLKGLTEARQAPSSLAAAEMIIIRLGYAAPLPPPAALMKDIMQGKVNAPAAAAPSAPAPAAPLAPVSYIAEAVEGQPAPASFTEVVELFKNKKEMVLYHALLEDVHLVSFEIGRIELSLTENAASDVAGSITKHLMEWTGKRWLVIITKEAGQPTLQQKKDAAAQQVKDESALHPVVSAVLQQFPGSVITAVHQNTDASIETPYRGERNNG